MVILSLVHEVLVVFFIWVWQSRSRAPTTSSREKSEVAVVSEGTPVKIIKNMVQSRICSYYKHVCTHASLEPTTFLSLPEDLRHRIYRQAAFITDTSIHLRVRDGVPFFCAEHDTLLAAFESYFNLRLVSRVVNADVARCLCSNNKILLCRGDISEKSLSVLLDAPLGLLNWLRRLIIILNASTRHNAGCHSIYIFCYRISDYHPYEKPAFNSISTRFKNFLPIWSKMINRFALSTNVSKVELDLICDVEDATIARLILKPLE